MKRPLRNIVIAFSLIALFFVAMPVANAHIVGGNGWGSGALHPLSGLDHLLAMVAVGIISTRYSSRFVWIIPLFFVASMVLGGIMAIAGLHVPFVEIGIALSVIFLGIAIFLQQKIPLPLTILFVIISAILHGHAHGEELPSIASPLFFTLGFVITTTMLHLTGVVAGFYATRTCLSMKLLRYAAFCMSVFGLLFLV